MVHIRAKRMEEHIGAERDGALSCYHGLLQSVREVVKATDEPNAGRADTLTQLRLSFEEECKMKAVASLAGPSQKRLWAGKWAPVKRIRAENATLSCFQKPALTCGGKSARWSRWDAWSQGNIFSDAHSKCAKFHVTFLQKIRADAKNLRKQNIKLAWDVQDKDVCAMVAFAWLKVVTQELANVKSKLSASREEGANSRWSAHSISNGASKVEKEVSRTLIAAPGEVMNGTRRKISIIALELMDALTREFS